MQDQKQNKTYQYLVIEFQLLNITDYWEESDRVISDYIQKGHLLYVTLQSLPHRACLINAAVCDDITILMI